VPRELQRREKQDELWSLLEQVGVDVDGLRGSVVGDDPWCWVASPQGYRNRIRLRLDDGVPRFFNPNKDLRCPVLEPSLRQWLEQFVVWCSTERDVLVHCKHAELRGRDLDGQRAVMFAPMPDRSVDWTAASEHIRASLPDGVLGWIQGAGTPPLQRVALVPNVFAYVPVGSFRQVNSPLNAALIDRVTAYVVERGYTTFIDVFCGSGNFSLPLLVAGCRGVGVESDAEAISALRRAALDQGVDGSGFCADDAANAAARWLALGPRPDVIIVDPPRAGAKATLETLLDLAPRALVLVSCNARSFANDLCRARGRGFTLERLFLGDMFPHTDHFEIVAMLRAR